MKGLGGRGPAVAGAAALVAAALASCSPPPPPPPDPTPVVPAGPAWFEDVTDRLGVHFTHDPGPVPGNYLLPQINGSGCAAADLDGDGRPDLLFLTAGGQGSPARNALFRQKADGTFEDVSAGSGLDFPGHNLGVAVGDVDDDGKPDVVVTQYGGVRLFRNLGGMKFRDATDEAGVWSRGWATSAGFLDYDRDGRLDLVVVHGVDVDPSWKCSGPDGEPGYCSPNVFPGAATRLFHNASGGGAVRFEDATVASGFAARPGPGLGVACADFDGDGWPDVFVANDAKPNHLWVNQRDGTFREEAPTRGVAYNGMGKAWAGMGIAVGDADGDGLADILVSHLGIETNTLWAQGPLGHFSDKTAGSGLAGGGWRGTGWGVALTDFDCDGRLDSAVVNGRVQRGPAANEALGPFWTRYAERNQLFAGGGGGAFRDRSADEPALCGTPNNARGLAVADLDGNGALDLVVTAIAARARVYRNVCPGRGHWLLVRCVDPGRGGRDALGAEVALTVGGVRRLAHADPGGSFLSSSDPRAHFGLGAASAVDGIEVRWSDGTREAFPGGPADRAVVLGKGRGTPVGR